MLDAGYYVKFGYVANGVFAFLGDVEEVGLLGGEVVGGGGVF